MRKNIRYSFVVAMAAVAVSAASASAAPPAWFGGADTNDDGSVSWSEYVRDRSAFEALDANGDGAITHSEEMGGNTRTSSWVLVSALDLNESGAVTLREYTRALRAKFDAYDVNQDGSLSDLEADVIRQARNGGDRRFGGRDFGGRATAFFRR